MKSNLQGESQLRSFILIAMNISRLIDRTTEGESASYIHMTFHFANFRSCQTSRNNQTTL